MNVSDVMTAQVVTANPRTTVKEVAQTMAKVETGAVPVVEGDKVVGLVTDRDIVLRAIAEGRGLDTAVAEVMTSDVETCREDDDVADAADKMGQKQIRRLVVLNDKGGLAGILSLGDVAVEYKSKAVGRTLGGISENSPASH